MSDEKFTWKKIPNSTSGIELTKPSNGTHVAIYDETPREWSKIDEQREIRSIDISFHRQFMEFMFPFLKHMNLPENKTFQMSIRIDGDQYESLMKMSNIIDSENHDETSETET